MFDFTGRNAVVTGGAKGIGEATVRRFAADNAAGVAILDIEDSNALARELDPSGGKVLPIRCDITDRNAVQSAFQEVYDTFGRVDFMINNAGIARDGQFHTLSDDEWDIVQSVNVQGAYNCTRQVINRMRDQEFGRIVLFSSIGTYGVAGQSFYSASKGALFTLTKNLAREQTRKGITVNCVIPGPIDTDLLAYVHETARKNSGNPNYKPPDLPTGQPRDVASLICFLCTDEAYYINGARIDINGGAQ